ncbi:hypothetical protein IFM89_011053 [Coptis chinensis]|uniref:Aminotransferase-like plant mobile domain-containing protein n=1 Tax=Coptis chinensis TaxID=261450 RepID=A0A835M5E6_9MAGN|nr:hypothetical protein IFM89_011053 [Coptis chinensis]
MPPRKRFFGSRELCDEESTTSSVQNLGQEDEFVAQTPDENTLFEPIVFTEFTNPQQHPPLIQSPETHVSNRVLENQGVTKWLIRCFWESVQIFWKTLRSRKEPGFIRICNAILATPFGGIINILYLQNDKALIYSLVERWWDTTHSFHFPWGEATITPLDFTMFTGLSIGRGRLLQSDRSYETFEMAHQLFPGKEFEDDDSFKALRLSPTNWTCTGIQCRWFEDRSAMNDIDFGGAIYAYLFRGMDEDVRIKSSRGQIVGFCIILQYWWFEYARTLNPIQDSLYNADEIPRIKAWGKDRIEKHYGMLLWYRENHWPCASSFITIDDGTYDTYWVIVSRGSLLPGPVYRASNLDLVTPEALRHDLQFPRPSQATYAPSAYNAHVLLGVDPTDDVWTARMVGLDGELVNCVIPHIDDSVLPQLDPHIEEHDVDTLRYVCPVIEIDTWHAPSST